MHFTSSAGSSSSTHDFAAANKTHFDARATAAHGDDPHDSPAHPENTERARRTVNAMRQWWPELFDEDRTEAMDYACGLLCQHVKSVLGVDISQAAVDRYNARASDQGLAPDEVRAVCAELTLTGTPAELARASFDLIVCCASYHHFPSIADTTRVLAAHLAPGGALLVADVLAAPDGREIFPRRTTTFAFAARMRATGESTRWFIAKGLKGS
ncbi:S-adenosyl-L-methionine-dependent methyltransferase [Epithele typhae]|uniref:S-adenosyl-L-methionine-dependent methyltransferase n=1 Tax=Epithele typhae TaxID=378194 RepID=UPI002007E133|nr:S-adenosyl-L-methionine-dependent methyltransferase [Epithele typhae]KAH9911686.1 S-adenosyl-L-methionine-dependent methyltransferase [Epithele typhae]